MSSLDFSRSYELTLIAKEGRLFNGVFNCAKSNSGSVDFTGKEIVMEVWNQNRDVLIATYSVSGGEVSVSTDQIILSEILAKATLPKKKYYFQVFNDDDKVGIGHGPFHVI